MAGAQSGLAVPLTLEIRVFAAGITDPVEATSIKHPFATNELPMLDQHLMVTGFAEPYKVLAAWGNQDVAFGESRDGESHRSGVVAALGRLTP